MLEPRYVLYSFYEDSGFRKFIYWDTKEKTFAISENRKSGIIATGFSLFIVSLIDVLGIKINLGPYINNGINWQLLIIIPLISLIVFKVLYFIQNNKEKDFYDLNITNNIDVMIKIIYKTRKNMVKNFIKLELASLAGFLIFILGITLKDPITKQLMFIIFFYLIESMIIIGPFIMYLPGYKIAKELKQQYPLIDDSSKKDDKKWY